MSSESFSPRSCDIGNGSNLPNGNGHIDVKLNEDSKKNENNVEGAPSKVVHMRNLYPEFSASDICSMVIPFGLIEDMILSKKIFQVLVQMKRQEDAEALVNYYKDFPITLHGKKIGVQFSRHQFLALHSENTQVMEAINNANSMVERDLAGMNSEAPNTVLRVVISNAMGYQINNMILYKIFHTFGHILRMVIYVRQDKIHALIEFESSRQAHVAMLHLNNQNIFTGCCNLRVEFSKNRGPLELRGSSDRYRDYTNSPLSEMEQQSLRDMQSGKGFNGPVNNYYLTANHLSHMFQNLSTGGFSSQQLSLAGQTGQAFNELSAQLTALAQQSGFSLTPQAAAATASFMTLNAGGQQGAHSGQVSGSNGSVAPNQTGAPSSTAPNIDLRLYPAEGPVALAAMAAMRGLSPSAGRPVISAGIGAYPHSNSNGSTVLMVSNLNDERVSPDALFTLFGELSLSALSSLSGSLSFSVPVKICFSTLGVYGDVTRVKIMFNKKDTALVQFADSQQAYTALQYLYDVRLWGRPMRITLSRHCMVQMPREDSDSCLTKDYSTSTLHRFRKPNSKNYNNIYAPCEVLHLSNIPPSVSEEEVRALFENKGYQVKGFRFMNPDRRMALIQLDSLETAVEALIDLHNTQLSENAHLRISFSKSGF
ncbi:Polypyrimidine tract-binding protein 2 [Cichlidogyrus casuarinus]|uniref:Polypyrimidine tract-binding protein 2 n=1 Tax=Cichlidogyrus casuarinus TaxID=1844966 RepID=A0ABD2Q5Y9_9PLAT